MLDQWNTPAVAPAQVSHFNQEEQLSGFLFLYSFIYLLLDFVCKPEDILSTLNSFSFFTDSDY